MARKYSKSAGKNVEHTMKRKKSASQSAAKAARGKAANRLSVGNVEPLTAARHRHALRIRCLKLHRIGLNKKAAFPSVSLWLATHDDWAEVRYRAI